MTGNSESNSNLRDKRASSTGRCNTSSQLIRPYFPGRTALFWLYSVKASPGSGFGVYHELTEWKRENYDSKAVSDRLFGKERCRADATDSSSWARNPSRFGSLPRLAFATIEPSTVTPRAMSLPDPRAFPPALV